jgi:hypothetical protein
MKRARMGTGRRPRDPRSIVTGMSFSASPGQVWDGLMFYEQIPRRPPIHLRLLLPAPMRAEGRGSAVGDETRCVYDKGHLLKRLTRIEPWRHCEFDVVEQELAIGGGIRLTSGSYTLLELPGGSTRMELETRYVSAVRPRWLWRRIEAAVCYAFHRHLLGAMRREVESRGSKTCLVRKRRLGSGPVSGTGHRAAQPARRECER